MIRFTDLQPGDILIEDEFIDVDESHSIMILAVGPVLSGMSKQWGAMYCFLDEPWAVYGPWIATSEYVEWRKREAAMA